MATVEKILNTDLPKPTFVLQPSRAAPVPSDATVNRSSGAWTQTPTGVYEYKSAGQPRAYGAEQSLLVEAPQLTNFIDHREVGSGGWGPADTGTGVTRTTGKEGIDETPNAVQITDNVTYDYQLYEFSYNFASDNGDGWTAVVFFKKTGSITDYPGARIVLGGGTTNVKEGVSIDTENGTVVTEFETEGKYSVVDAGDWWKVILTVNNNGSGNTDAAVSIYPAVDDGTGADIGATGSAIVDAPTLVRHDDVPTDGSGYAALALDISPIMLEDPSGYPAQVVKNKEDINSFVDSGNEITFLCEFTPLSQSPSQFQILLRYSEGGVWANIVFLENEKLNSNVYEGGTSTFGNIPLNIGQKYRIAASYRNGGVASVTLSDGQATQTKQVDTSFSMPGGGDGATLYLNGGSGKQENLTRYHSIAAYPKFLSQQAREILVS